MGVPRDGRTCARAFLDVDDHLVARAGVLYRRRVRPDATHRRARGRRPRRWRGCRDVAPAAAGGDGGSERRMSDDEGDEDDAAACGMGDGSTEWFDSDGIREFESGDDSHGHGNGAGGLIDIGSLTDVATQAAKQFKNRRFNGLQPAVKGSSTAFKINFLANGLKEIQLLHEPQLTGEELGKMTKLNGSPISQQNVSRIMRLKKPNATSDFFEPCLTLVMKHLILKRAGHATASPKPF